MMKRWVCLLAVTGIILSVCSSVAFGMGKKKTNLVAPVAGVKSESIYPRSAPPAETVYVFDAFGVDAKTKTLINTAQGIINRDLPQLYLILEKPGGTAAAKEALEVKHDLNWLEWLKDNGYLGETKTLGSVRELLEAFGVRNVVVPDETLPVGLNIATMYASVMGTAVAYPEQVEEYGLAVVEDFRGRFKTNAEAYEWAYEMLWPEMNHSILGYLAPIPEISHLRDYLVAKKIFTFWVTGEIDGDNPYSNTDKELALARKMLGEMPTNIAVIGYPWAGKGVGIGEQNGVKLISNYGKFLVPMDWKANLTIWTGLQAKTKEFRQLPPRNIPLEKGRIYAALMISDGDNLNTWYDYFPMYWESPYRGQIPIGWAMGPSLIDLQAPLLDYYYPTLRATDSFGCAFGIGYIYPGHFATGYDEKQRKKIWDEFVALTRAYMARLDMNWMWIINHGGITDEMLEPFAKGIPTLTCLLPGYGSQTPYEEANYLLDGVPVFHSVNKGYWPDKIMDEIRARIPAERPGFMHIFLQNWAFDYGQIKAFVEALPADFVMVRPDELAALYETHQALQSAAEPK